jgi:hypothetical protein
MLIQVLYVVEEAPAVRIAGIASTITFFAQHAPRANTLMHTGDQRTYVQARRFDMNIVAVENTCAWRFDRSV